MKNYTFQLLALLSTTMQEVPYLDKTVDSFSSPLDSSLTVYIGYPGRGQQLLIQNGGISVSNIRILYLPTLPTASFQSFSIPLQNLE